VIAELEREKPSIYPEFTHRLDAIYAADVRQIELEV
jgi:hypothetical protein